MKEMKKANGKLVVGVLLLIVLGLSLLALAIQKATNDRKEQSVEGATISLAEFDGIAEA